MSARFQMGLVSLAAFFLAGCIVVVRQPAADPFAMRVTKDGTEILLRHSYSKVKAALEIMVPPNMLRHGFEPGAAADQRFRVSESVIGEACRVRLDEMGVASAYWHFTVIEARRVADGLTQVQVRGERGRVNYIFPGSTKKRDTGAEQRRLTELTQTIAR